MHLQKSLRSRLAMHVAAKLRSMGNGIWHRSTFNGSMPDPGPRHFSSLTEEKAPTAEKHTCRRHLSSIPFAIEGIG